MTKQEKRQVYHYLCSIIMVTSFLVLSTMYLYYPKKQSLDGALSYAKSFETISIRDLSDGIHLSEAYPIADEEGMESVPYQFMITNYSDKEVTYQIIFMNNREKIKSYKMEPLDNHYLRFGLEKESTLIESPKNLDETGVLATITIAPREEQKFAFRVWLDYDADNGAQNKSFLASMQVKEVMK